MSSERPGAASPAGCVSPSGCVSPAGGRGVLLTADLGNSGLKLTLWPAPEGPRGPILPRPLARLQTAPSEDLGPRLATWFLELAEPEERGGLGPFSVLAQALCAVGSRDDEARVREVLAALAPEILGHPPASGVENTCRHPETVGADRLFAARGAAELVGGSAIVVDAGTALTVDALRWEGPGGPPPRFLGGAIAPGPALLAKALAGGAARLPEVAQRPAPPALGLETAEAIASGVGVGLWGAAAELARRVGLESGLAGAPRVVTGGARAFLLEPVPFWPGDVREAPDLVAFGIWAALSDARVGVGR